MISTNRLLLRPWQESDLEFIQKLRNDIDLQALLLSTAKGSSLQSVRRWVEDKSTGSERLFFLVELLDIQKPIGYIQLFLEPGATLVFRLGLCLSPPFQAQGYGTELIRAIESYLKISHDARKIVLHVDEANIRAIACYRKLGYREVGVLYHHIYIHGFLRNVMIMEKSLESILELSH